MLLDKRIHITFIRRLTNKIGDVKREKVARFNELINIAQPDMVGIDKIGVSPSTGTDGLVSLSACILWRCAYDSVLPMRLVPNRRDVEALLFCLHQGSKLGLSLAAEPVTNSERILFQNHTLAFPSIDCHCERSEVRQFAPSICRIRYHKIATAIFYGLAMTLPQVSLPPHPS